MFHYWNTKQKTEGRLYMKMLSYQYSIPMIKIRRSHDSLFSLSWKSPYLERWSLYVSKLGPVCNVFVFQITELTSSLCFCCYIGTEEERAAVYRASLNSVYPWVYDNQEEVSSSPGVGVTKPISSVPLFSEFFSIVKTHVRYWISHLYLTGITAAELRWYLSSMNVNQRI